MFPALTGRQRYYLPFPPDEQQPQQMTIAAPGNDEQLQLTGTMTSGPAGPNMVNLLPDARLMYAQQDAQAQRHDAAAQAIAQAAAQLQPGQGPALQSQPAQAQPSLARINELGRDYQYTDPFLESAKQAWRGVEGLWGASQPVSSGWGAAASGGRIPTYLQQKAGAVSDIIRGAGPFLMAAGVPAVAAGGGGAIGGMLGGLVGGGVAQEGAEALALKMGMSPETARLLGDAAGFYGGWGGHKFATMTPEARAEFGRNLPQRLGQALQQFWNNNTGSLTLPFAPKREPQPGQLTQELRAQQQEQLSPRVLEKAKQFGRGVPGFRDAAGYMTPGELQTTVAQEPNVQKVMRLLDILPKEAQIAATAKAGMVKRGWYRGSGRAILDLFGQEDAPRFSALLAALSPQTSVESNLQNALRTWTNWVKAGRPRDPRQIRAIMGASVQGKGTEASVLEAWAQNAERALGVENPLRTVLSGAKVNSFFRNIMGDVFPVTNDAWIANAMGVAQELFGGSGTEAGMAWGNPGYSSGYNAASVAQRRAAQRLGMQPMEVQETYWSTVMALYEKAVKLGISPQEVLQRGLLTQQDIMGTPDFGTILPRYRHILEPAGYGEALSKLRPYQFPEPQPLNLAEQRGLEQTAETLGQLKEIRDRESRAMKVRVSGTRPESGFVHATAEQVPGRGTGIFPTLVDEPYNVRKAYSQRVSSPFKDIQGHDRFHRAVDLPTIDTVSATGAWRPEGDIVPLDYRQRSKSQREGGFTGELAGDLISELQGNPPNQPMTSAPRARQPQEINSAIGASFESPIRWERVPVKDDAGNIIMEKDPTTGRMRQKKEWKAHLPQSVENRVNATEALRGSMTGQHGSAYNLQAPNEEGTSAFVPRKKKAPRDQMGLAAHVAGGSVSPADSGRGVSLINWAKEALSTADLNFFSDLLGKKGVFRRTTNVSGYIDQAKNWNEDPGKNRVVTKMMGYFDKLSKDHQERLSGEAQEVATELLKTYESTAEKRKEPLPEYFLRYIKDLSEGGIPKVRAALASGKNIYPAILLAILARDRESQPQKSAD